MWSQHQSSNWPFLWFFLARTLWHRPSRVLERLRRSCYPSFNATITLLRLGISVRLLLRLQGNLLFRFMNNSRKLTSLLNFRPVLLLEEAQFKGKNNFWGIILRLLFPLQEESLIWLWTREVLVLRIWKW